MGDNIFIENANVCWNYSHILKIDGSAFEVDFSFVKIDLNFTSEDGINNSFKNLEYR